MHHNLKSLRHNYNQRGGFLSAKKSTIFNPLAVTSFLYDCVAFCDVFNTSMDGRQREGHPGAPHPRPPPPYNCLSRNDKPNDCVSYRLLDDRDDCNWEIVPHLSAADACSNLLCASYCDANSISLFTF